MNKIIDVAGYIVKKYQEIAGEKLDELKLHKLLYFTQREAFAVMGEPAFEGTFEGWKYGPVCKEVRAAFCNGEIIVPVAEITDEIKYIVNNVITEYGSFASWRLMELSHKETSWQKARVGLSSTENGNQPILIDDIREDAKKVRPYDHVWDMYYDEFQTEDSPE